MISSVAWLRTMPNRRHVRSCVDSCSARTISDRSSHSVSVTRTSDAGDAAVRPAAQDDEAILVAGLLRGEAAQLLAPGVLVAGGAVLGLPDAAVAGDAIPVVQALDEAGAHRRRHVARLVALGERADQRLEVGAGAGDQQRQQAGDAVAERQDQRFRPLQQQAGAERVGFLDPAAARRGGVGRLLRDAVLDGEAELREHRGERREHADLAGALRRTRATP